MSLLIWQTKEFCYAFPGMIIDVRAGYIITNDRQFQCFKNSLLGLYVNYNEKYNYHEGCMSYDIEDCRIQVSTDVITRPPSDFPGGKYEIYNGTDDVVVLNAQKAEYALCEYQSNYVIQLDKIVGAGRDVEMYLREYVTQAQIAYPLKNISVRTENTHETVYSYNTEAGGSVTVRTHTRASSAPRHYKALYTKEEFIALINSESPQSTRPEKRIKIGL